jgi:hypothetical protein
MFIFPVQLVPLHGLRISIYEEEAREVGREQDYGLATCSQRFIAHVVRSAPMWVGVKPKPIKGAREPCFR